MKKKHLIGKTIVGFSFEGSGYNPEMDEQIGVLGRITEIKGKFVLVYFEKNNIQWYYPLKEVKINLIEDLKKLSEDSKRFFKDSEEKVDFTIQEIADIIDIPVGLLRIKL